MINIITNGGLELILATIRMAYVLILAKIGDQKAYRKSKPAMW